MTAPLHSVFQMEFQNPGASLPLILPILVLGNTPDEEIKRNIRANSALDLEWLKATPAHDGIAVMVGGGASVSDYVCKIAEIQENGGTVFAMNGASKWLWSHQLYADFQCILDAKEETQSLVDPNARAYLFGSQVHPETMAAADSPIVWHCNTGGDMEQDFPPEKVAAGGYCLVAGGSAVGNSALYAVYALGFRKFHLFGYDSCHKDGEGHAYEQPMNRFIPCVTVEWAGKFYTSSVAMKTQAEDFQITSQALGGLGCEFEVYGEGLLQAMWNTKPEDLTERDKYRRMWSFDAYRKRSPGEEAVGLFLKRVRPDGMIIDFGCGTGRAGISLHKAGHDVFLVDFADNCRDEEAMGLPFLEWDLTVPCPASAPFGFCTDVMEHIPTDDVKTVLDNIMASADTVFFQICTEMDRCGMALIKTPLHLTVKPHDWWKNVILDLGHTIVWERWGGRAGRKDASTFVLKSKRVEPARPRC